MVQYIFLLAVHIATEGLRHSTLLCRTGPPSDYFTSTHHLSTLRDTDAAKTLEQRRTQRTDPFRLETVDFRTTLISVR